MDLTGGFIKTYIFMGVPQIPALPILAQGLVITGASD
jgi:hypothetical protein